MADLSGLLEPVSAEQPCGDNLEYDNARVALDTNILGTPENQFSGEKALPPNWREVYKEALALLQRSKDLQVILYLIRTLINVEGWRGFRDGLSFLEESLTRYWDSIHPQLDPDDGMDPTSRINILEELASFDLIIRPLSLAVLVESKAIGRFCLRDIQYATDRLEVPKGMTKPDNGAINAAFLDMDDAALADNYQALVDSIKIVERIDAFVNEKVGASQGAVLTPLKALLKEVRDDFDHYAGSRLSNDAETEASDDGGSTEAGDEVKPVKSKAVSGAIESRQDVVRTLDALCKYYADYEPSSPVPILLRRAKHLATADFLEIVQNLMPDALSQISAIKGPDPS
ncbi:type VI secretion system protein TssA [Methylomonas sp. BW4-1]|uniref:type VI secretion system protein TssA n=1 Tax=Methylomonas sp. BW4-1 TaxID=3376685 RepID=UPI0040425652